MNVFQQTRSKLMINHAFFGALAMSTEMIRDDNIPTACTDMKKVWYNLQFLESLELEVVMFVLVHELMHIMLMHGLRRGMREPRLWNIAADHAINLMLKDMGFKLWAKCCCDPRFTGMGAEEIYDILHQEREERGGDDADGDDDGIGGDLREPEDMSPVERAEIEQAIRQQIAQAAAMGRMAGQMPSALERLVDGILSPPLPWQELLRKYATQYTTEDETWSRRNRRFPHVYLPSRWSERMGEIVIIGDTSGSMGNEVFAQIAAEINCINEFCKPERTRVVWADAEECSFEEVFEAGGEVVLHPKGGGGTDMRKPLRYVEQYDPVVCILITDGYTPWPKEDPPYPLIVCCTTAVDVPVGDVVRMR
jgi:predicted metal-dependent peptidase